MFLLGHDDPMARSTGGSRRIEHIKSLDGNELLTNNPEADVARYCFGSMRSS
jgi:hypothetical protein